MEKNLNDQQPQSTLDLFLKHYQDMRTTIQLANLHRWHSNYKIEEEENMLYKHIYLIPKRFDFITFAWLKYLDELIKSYTIHLDITLSITMRQTQIVTEDYRAFSVMVPSVDIQICIPNEE